MDRFARLRVLLAMAWRNLFSHKGKNLIVGLIMIFGTFLVVLGTSLLDGIERSMARSITSSIAGHLQVYSQDARDDLALFGSGFMGAEDIGAIADFAEVKRALLQVPNVKAVVPMGTDAAEFYTATELDHTIERLRQAIAQDDQTRIALVTERLRAMAELLQEEFENRKKVLRNLEEVDAQLSDIARARSDAFWAGLDERPDEVIEFLDTKIAPLVDENEGYFLRYLGTDLHLFKEHFDQFELASGQMVPQGERGMLLNQKFYDDYLRNRVARDLDELHRDIKERGKTIAADPLLRNRVERMARQYRRVTFQLEPEQAEALAHKLREQLPEATGNIDELVQRFLRLDDTNFELRRAFFYNEIAPQIRMYLFDVGDVITIRAYTKSGYVKSINIKVYGTFRFKGLEKSDLAGAYSLMDIVSFRDLYGMMTKEKREELSQIQADVGLPDIERKDAEAALFAEPAEIVTQQRSDRGFDELEGVELAPREERVNAGRFDQQDIDQGIALNAAIVLEDASLLEQTRVGVKAAIERHGLGLQVVDWQQASGMVGQLVVLIRVVLYIAIFIIFLVALVIINNTMIMATMERVTEIGTMRAIGAQSRFVLVLFLLETVILGTIAGLIGAGLGAGLVQHLGTAGIPAVEDILVFLFSGPRLYPTVGAGNLLAALVVILAVSLVATFYPAFVATRIQPVVAMQARE